MKKLNKEQFDKLVKFKYNFHLAKTREYQKYISNSDKRLISNILEELTGNKVDLNCNNCYKEWMIKLADLYYSYEIPTLEVEEDLNIIKDIEEINVKPKKKCQQKEKDMLE